MNGKFVDEIKLLRFVWDSAHGNHLKLAIIMVLQVITGLIPAGVTYLMPTLAGNEWNNLSELFTMRNIIIGISLLLASLLLKQFTSLFSGYAMADIKRNIDRRYIDRLATLPYSMVNDTMDNRNIMAMSVESDMTTALIPMTYRSFLRAPITILAFLCLLLYLSPLLTLIVLTLVLAIVTCCVILRRQIKAISRELYNRLSDLHQNFAEYLRGYKIFSVYEAIPFISRTLYKVVDDTNAISKKKIRIKVGQSLLIEILTYTIAIAVILLIKYLDIKIDLIIAVSFPAAIFFIRNEALCIVNGYNQLNRTEGGTRRLMKIFRYSPDNNPKREWSEPITQISFNNVSFAYRKDADNVLSNANTIITKGGINAIVGYSGQGKSTSMDLLLKLRNPDTGEILFNGKDISEYSSESIHRHISLVEQEPIIFDGTIADNITFGENHNPVEIIKLFNTLQLSYLVASIDDLNRQILSNKLSSGEKQRIAFIRALLRNPDVILLDEFTSNIDDMTVNIMIGILQESATDKFIICVTHDPRITNIANHIITLNNGNFKTQEKIL